MTASGSKGRPTAREIVSLRQFGFLSRRYIDVLMGLPGQVAALLVQVPVIASIVWIVLHGEGGEPREPQRLFYFVLALSALWLGLMNACMEIAREAAIYRRERKVGLELNAYLLSKFAVLALMGAMQCALLVLIIVALFNLKGNPLLHFAGLSLTCMAATAVGLLISAVAMSVEKAIAMVPMLMLVHFLFSGFFVSFLGPAGAAGTEKKTDTLDVIEKLSIATWAEDFLLQAAGGPEKFPMLPVGQAPAHPGGHTPALAGDDADVNLTADRARGMATDAGVLLLFMAAHLLGARAALRFRERSAGGR